jgi:hypothetical protein
VQIARLLDGPFGVVIYLPLFMILNRGSKHAAQSAGAPVYEEA